MFRANADAAAMAPQYPRLRPLEAHGDQIEVLTSQISIQMKATMTFHELKQYHPGAQK
jgi:hypothetical protein